MSSLILTRAIVFTLISIPIRHYMRVGITQLKSNEAIVLVKKLNEAIVLVKIKPSEAIVLAKTNKRRHNVCLVTVNKLYKQTKALLLV